VNFDALFSARQLIRSENDSGELAHATQSTLILGIGHGASNTESWQLHCISAPNRKRLPLAKELPPET